MSIVIAAARTSDLDDVVPLLAAEGLPVDDIAADGVHLWVARDDKDGAPVGCVGLERHGDSGLLRSLAVAPPLRGTGLGARLLARAEQAAHEGGVTSLYLLTTGDGAFFARHGFSAKDRAAVPESIRRTRQFSSLCPSSARLMGKGMAGSVATAQS